MIQIPPGQEEEEQHHAGVEVRMGATGDGFVQAHASGKDHRERNRHVHVQAAMRESLRSRTEEGAPGIGRRRQGDQRGKPMEEIPRRGFGA